MRTRISLFLALSSVFACGGATPEVENTAPPPASAPALIDEAMLAEILAEATQLDGTQVRADGLLVRLAFEPLIRGVGPVELEKVQGQGYRLVGVRRGSPLWQLGLHDRDVLTQVDGQPIVGTESPLLIAWMARPSQVKIDFLRGEEAEHIELVITPGGAWLGSEPEPEPEPESEPETDSASAIPFAQGLRCVASSEPGRLGRCELTRAALDATMADLDQLSRLARIVPVTSDAGLRGFKLFGIRRGTSPEQLGLKNGDLIQSVNGAALDSLDAAMGLFVQLRDAAELEIEIVRKGEATRLTIEIVDALSGPAAAFEPDDGRRP